MAEKRTYPLLPEEQCLSQEQLFRYIDGQLASSEMHAAEKHLLDCGLCSDALDGLQLVRNREKVAAVIPAVTAAEPESEKEPGPVVISIFSRPAFWYSAAASVTLIIGLTTLLRFQFNESDFAKEAPQLAENSSRNMDSIAAPAPGEGKPELAAAKDANKNGPADFKDLEQDPKATGPASQSKETNMPKPAFEKSFSADKYVSGEQKSADVPPAVEEIRLAETDDADGAKYDEPNTGQVARTEAAEDNRKEEQNKLKSYADKVLDAVAKKDQVGNNTQSRASMNAAGTSAPPASTSGGAQSDSSEKPTVMKNVGDTTVQSGPYPLKPSDGDLNLSYENGVKMLDAGKANASLPFFDEVLKNPSHAHYQDAQWKKADALIKLNRKEEAKQLLNTLASKEGKYKAQAQEKLKTL